MSIRLSVAVLTFVTANYRGNTGESVIDNYGSLLYDILPMRLSVAVVTFIATNYRSNTVESVINKYGSLLIDILSIYLGVPFNYFY